MAEITFLRKPPDRCRVDFFGAGFKSVFRILLSFRYKVPTDGQKIGGFVRGKRDRKYALPIKPLRKVVCYPEVLVEEKKLRDTLL